MPTSSGNGEARHSVSGALHRAAQQLGAATDRPRLEAELLLADLLSRPRSYLLAHPEETLSPVEVCAYNDRVIRRAGGEPLPYITGHVEFYGLDFTVTPAVLIPRPETETLVEMALTWLAEHPAQAAADVGTGSGCIAVTLAVKAPALYTYAIDCSPAALAVAEGNALRHGAASRIAFREGDLLAPLPGPVDLLASNPPYVAEAEWLALPLSVRQEPRTALLSGPQGLDAIGRLLAQAPQKVRPGGLVLVEIGETQGAAVLALARAAFPEGRAAILPDLAGRERFLRVERAPV